MEFGQKKHSSALIRTISGSKFCRGDALASQVDKQALVSVDRKSISLSENRIVKAAMMQKQMGDLEEELKSTKERLDAAERERNRALAELKETKALANRGLSPEKAEQVFLELKSLKDELSKSRKEMEARDKEIALLSESKKRIRELEDKLEKAEQSESHMLESFMLQTRQIEETKMDLEESKLEIAALQEKLENVEKNKGWKNESMVDRRGNLEGETKALKDEIKKLKSEVQFATEAEENSKMAMDGLASALREVAMEASTANEKLKSTEAELTQLKEMLKTQKDKYKRRIDELENELELQKNTAEQLRSEAEEAHLAWNGKEMGFISCIRKADEESALSKHENNRLKEAIVAAENSAMTAKEEAFKLRDILKQAISESNVAKEAANMARSENSELKDLLAEKEDALHFLTKENERLRINEVAARENVKEFKRLLAAKAEVISKPPCDDKDQADVFNSPLSSLYEDHLDGRTTPQQTFSFDLDDLKVFNKEEEKEPESDSDDNSMADLLVDAYDPEKAEALKGSIFDTAASPKSEPQTPRPKSEHRRSSSVYNDPAGTTARAEEGENSHNESSSHTEETEDKSYYSYYTNYTNYTNITNISKKKLFRKIGDIMTLKIITTGKKDGPTEQTKEPGKEPAKEPAKEQSN